MARNFLSDAGTPKSSGDPSGVAAEQKQLEINQPEELNWYEALQAGDPVALKKAASKEISAIVAKHGLENYEILLLFDDVDNISYYHLDKLYAAASKKNKKDILLILQIRADGLNLHI